MLGRFNTVLLLALLAFGPFALSLPTNNDIWEEQSASTEAPPPPPWSKTRTVVKSGLLTKKPEYNVMADGGSTGTKVFGWKSTTGGSSGTGKIMTKCGAGSARGKTSLGVAMLQYDVGPGQCVAEITSEIAKPSNVKRDESAAVRPADKAELKVAFVNEFMQVAADIYHGLNCPTTKTCWPKNKGGIPILATAGNRLLSTDDNKNVWDTICGQGATIKGGTATHEVQEELKFATGDWCRTIPGTMEAWYEWVATALEPGSPEPQTAMLSMGGSSGQIAVPLYGDEDFQAWKDLIKTIGADPKFNCEKIKLPNYDNEKAQVLNTRNVANAKTKCLADYIDLYTISEMQALGYDTEVAEKAGKGKGDNTLQGVGLVSFLALHQKGGEGGLVAGGIIEVQNWANKLPECKESYAKCVTAMDAGLNSDPLYRNVKKFFKDNAHIRNNLQHFAFNTPNTNPSATFQKGTTLKNENGETIHPMKKFKDTERGELKPEVKGYANAATLKELLAKYCAPVPGSGVATQQLKIIEDKSQGQRSYNIMPGKMFGFKEQRSCAAQLYSAMYVDAFSKDAGVSEDKMQFGPYQDWIDGEVKAYANAATNKPTKTPTSACNGSGKKALPTGECCDRSTKVTKKGEQEMSTRWCKGTTPSLLQTHVQVRDSQYMAGALHHHAYEQGA